MLDCKINELESVILNNDVDSLYNIVDTYHPIDIAIYIENLPNESLIQLFNLLNHQQAAEIFEESTEELQIKLMSLLDYTSIINIFSFMSNDNIADILGELPIHMKKTLLKMMKSGDSTTLQQLLGYKKDSAGGIMTTEYIALNGELTISSTLKKIKEIGPKTEIIETIFVLNNKRELIGTADLRDILNSHDDELLMHITDDNIISVHPDMDQEEVSLLVSKYNLQVIPVVNRKNSLLGIITVDDIIDVIVEEQTEDILHLGGVSKEEKVDSSLSSSIKKRLPWLFVNLFTAFLAAFTVGLFEDVIEQVVALAAAMPIVAGMGGNSGTQTLSVVIRSISLGEINLKDNWKFVFKEILLGVINGAAIGLITGIILYLKYQNPYLGIIIFIAMICNLVIAGFFGFLIPLFLKVIGVDPALASAIFLTTATDVFGFFIFLGLAKLFLPLLI